MTDDPQHAADTTTVPGALRRDLPRRQALRVLAGTGALGLTAGVLAACGSGGAARTPDGEPGGSSDSDAGNSATGSPATTPGDDGESGGGPVGDPIATVADIPEGGGVILTAPVPVVITHPAAGEVKAFTAICTHMGCTVAQVQSNQIMCPCHGSHFDASTGAVVSGPAPAPLPAIEITVADGEVFLTG